MAENGLLKVAGIGFDHMHMGDLLRMVHKHPGASICGLADVYPEKMAKAAQKFGLSPSQLFTDYRACLEATRPDLVILCPSPAKHREWVEILATYGVHLLVDKPFAANLDDADAMIQAMANTGKILAINWPLAWNPNNVLCKKTIASGIIGEPLEVHYYGGNRGPLLHIADRAAAATHNILEDKQAAWWYQKDQGGGSMQDYLGYGVTLGTWFMNGQLPLEVMAITDGPHGLEVDEHSITIARYAAGLSKFETRWGTFTDPWTHQPQPKCGFTIVGSAGTVSSFDRENHIRIQDRKRPEGYDLAAEVLPAPYQNPIQYLIHCIQTNEPLTGPSTPAMSRIGQQIVDAAVLSAELKRPVHLKEIR